MLILDSIRDAFPVFDYHIGMNFIISKKYNIHLILKITGFISLIFLLVFIYALKFVLWVTVSIGKNLFFLARVLNYKIRNTFSFIKFSSK